MMGVSTSLAASSSGFQTGERGDHSPCSEGISPNWRKDFIQATEDVEAAVSACEGEDPT